MVVLGKDTSSNKEIVNRVNEAFADNNMEGFLSFCTNEVVWTMVGDRTVKGKDAIRQWMKSMDSPAPQFSVAAVIGDGDFVAAYGDMTMKDKEGKTSPYSYCDIYRFEDGKIAELRSYVMKTDAK